MKLELLDLETLQTQENYNVRSAKELAANAKDIAALMEATGDNPSDPRFMVRYVQDGKTRYTRSHATVEAAKLRGWKQVSAVKCAFEFGTHDDSIDLIASNNAGHPLTRYQQGEVFARLIAGVAADNFEGAVADPKSAKDWKVPPLVRQEIADKIGKSAQHVKDCIDIFEAPEFAREMAEADLISPAIILTAQKWARDDEKLMERILKGAIRNADGVRATQKNMDAVKADYVKQKAVTNAPNGDKAPLDAGNPASEAPASEKQDSRDESEPEPEPEQELQLEAPETAKKAPSKKDTKTVRTCLITIIAEHLDELDDRQVESMADKLIDSDLIVRQLPF